MVQEAPHTSSLDGYWQRRCAAWQGPPESTPPPSPPPTRERAPHAPAGVSPRWVEALSGRPCGGLGSPTECMSKQLSKFSIKRCSLMFFLVKTGKSSPSVINNITLWALQPPLWKCAFRSHSCFCILWVKISNTRDKLSSIWSKEVTHFHLSVDHLQNIYQKYYSVFKCKTFNNEGKITSNESSHFKKPNKIHQMWQGRTLGKNRRSTRRTEKTCIKQQPLKFKHLKELTLEMASCAYVFVKLLGQLSQALLAFDQVLFFLLKAVYI